MPEWCGAEALAKLHTAALNPHSPHRTTPSLPLPPAPLCVPSAEPEGSELRLPDHLNGTPTTNLLLGKALGLCHVHVGLLYGRGGGMIAQAEASGGEAVVGIDADPGLIKALRIKVPQTSSTISQK